MGHMACTEPQCLYKGALYLHLYKQKLSLLLGAYNMMNTVNFPTRLQNGHLSAIDSNFVDNSRMQSYEIFPLSNALSDHKAQCLILNKFFSESKVKNDKQK